MIGTDQQGVTHDQRKAVALEYFRRLDQGGDFFELFADDARVLPEVGGGRR